MYQAPAVHPPSVGDIERLAVDLNLGIAKKDVAHYHAVVSAGLKVYDVLEKYVEPTLPVKYPRTPGYRPPREENKYNAWYYKTTIHGAPEGILKGYKVVVKDSFPVAGVPWMHGSRVTEGCVPDYDPTFVTRVLDAGATIVGKATCENLCCSGSSFTSFPYPVLNPHDKTRLSGGSSSGCGVLVQTGEVDMALANDVAGSVRIPASWTGLVGLLPSYGLVPLTGLLAMVPAMDFCGPMARTVKDCALLLEAIAGDDKGLDMRQRRIPDPKDLPKYSQLLTGEVAGLKIGLVKEGFEGCEADVATLVTAAAKRLTEKRAIVEEVSIPMHADAIWVPSLDSAFHHTYLSGQGCPIGPPGYLPTSAFDNYFAYLKARPQDLSISGKVMHLRGKYIAENYGMRFYAKSQNLGSLIKEKYNTALEKYDVLVMPTMKFKAPKVPQADMSVPEYVSSAQHGISDNVAPFNMSGHPSVSLNAGFSLGLPVGMQITGRHLVDDVVLNVAYAYEQLLHVSK